MRVFTLTTQQLNNPSSADVLKWWKSGTKEEKDCIWRMSHHSHLSFNNFTSGTSFLKHAFIRFHYNTGMHYTTQE